MSTRIDGQDCLWKSALSCMASVPCMLALSFCFPAALQAAPLQTEDSVALAVGSIVEQIEPFLKKKRLRAINIGKFDSFKGTSAGPEIQTKLRAAFDRMDGFVIEKIDYDVSIRGRIEELPLENAVIVRIVAQLFDGRNRPIGQFSGDSSEVTAEVTGTEAVPRLLGITTAFTGDENQEERFQVIRENADRSPSVVQGSEVFAAEHSPYSMEIVLKQGQQFVPLGAQKIGDGGLPFAPIPDRQEFAVRLNNYSNLEAAAHLTLDGISSFAFSEQRPQATRWLIPPASGGRPGSVVVTGWDINDQFSYAFKNVGFPDSAMRELNIEPNAALGQICVHFSESYPVGKAGARSVGRGEIIEARKRSVPRELGPLRATIHIRYERHPEH